MDLCKTGSDFVRMIATELILYPVLVCDIFELATGAYKYKTTADSISFGLFFISSLALIFYVYVMRLFILGGTIYHVQKYRKPQTDGQMQLQCSGYDPDIHKNAMWWQSYFFIHVLSQTLCQILMLVAIGAKIKYENGHLFEKNNNDDEIHVSPYLWYMLVAGYITPIFGSLTFFIVNYYWVQEFSIGLCIDMLNVLELPGIVRRDSEGESRVEEIIQFMHFATLRRDFRDMCAKTWWDKFKHPFTSPGLVILCFIYFAYLLIFIIFATLAVSDDGDTTIVILNGGNWVYFYVTAVIFEIMVNIYVFLVAALWTAIITGIITIIVLAIVCLPCVCICGCLAICADD